MPVKKVKKITEKKSLKKTEKKTAEKMVKKDIKTIRDIKANRSRKKTNLLKLYSEMNRLVMDAVDREVVKRLKIIIESSEEDITKSNLDIILKHSEDIQLRQFHESLHPYVKHFVFMKKREISIKKKNSKG